MPLYKTLNPFYNTQVLLWQVTETEEALAKNLSLNTNSQKRLKAMKSSLHRRAFLSIRHLLAKAGYADFDLIYNSQGKPFLNDGTYVSISHSHQFTGIILSQTAQIGIDIEKKRDKILRIAPKFTPIQEYRTYANTDALITKVTQVWCAKEAVYKIAAIPGLSFLNHIEVADFLPEKDQTTVAVNYFGNKTNYAIKFDQFDEFCLAFAKL